MTRASKHLILPLACLLAMVAHALAQTSTTASLRGRILDDKAEGIPGVVVTLSNPAAAIAAQNVVTDLEGAFAFKLLPPANGYSLKASVPGYATVIAGPFDLDPGRVTVQNLTLKRSADLQETIKVEAQGEIVDTSSTKTTTTYSSELIEGLPLLGRKFNDILTLAPGVTDTDGDGNPNVRGSRDTGLQLRLDGTNVSDPLTGHFGQDVNLETIEEIEVITAGAPAEYGRADGGFASIITKSGGNQTEGSVKVFFRSKFLDGNGAGNNDGDRAVKKPDVPSFNDTRAFFTLGGAFVRDRFWYFTSVERLDRAEPVVFTDGSSSLTTQEGWRAFGKLTVQTNPDNKLTLQINYDPLEVGGNFIGSRTPAESDFTLRTGGPTAQVKWTSVISPTLLMELVLSRLDGGQATVPVSDAPRIKSIERQVDTGHDTVVKLPCATTNCAGDTGIFKYLRPVAFSILGPIELPASASGPYFFEDDDSRERTTMKADLSYTIEDHFGSHSIKTGFEFNDERYADQPFRYPILTDSTVSANFVRFPVQLPPYIRFGTLSMELFEPVRVDLSAKGLNAGAYLQDSWKPVPNLTVNLGLRYDHEDIASHGFTPFDPLAEARVMLQRFDALCEISPPCPTDREAGRRSRGLPGLVSLALASPGSLARQLDLNGDGFVDLSSGSREFANYIAPLTTYDERLTEGFSVDNANLSPRLSISWDPWADGKTKLFGTWNRYYDRLFLGVLTAEQQSQRFVAEWPVGATVDPNNQTVVTNIFQADPGKPSSPLSRTVSVNQVNHDLRTPYTDEWSFGIERELAPEWAVTLTYVDRRGIDLLQDKDVNHIFCPQFGDAFGVDPEKVCGDAGVLEMDKFGSASRTPNFAPDLFVLNEDWNQVLRTGNYNTSSYKSTDIMLRRRLHRDWQMQLSYTFSEARGSAEKLNDPTGNDPAVSDLAGGFLDFDQRHVLKWQGLVHLPDEIILAGTVQWASGLPFSIVQRVADDHDDQGNVIGTRIFFPTGKKNDQRNTGQWTLNARAEKRLLLGKTFLSGFLSGENLLNSDDLQLKTNESGSGVISGNTRRFGRRWEIGVAVEF